MDRDLRLAWYQQTAVRRGPATKYQVRRVRGRGMGGKGVRRGRVGPKRTSCRHGRKVKIRLSPKGTAVAVVEPEEEMVGVAGATVVAADGTSVPITAPLTVSSGPVRVQISSLYDPEVAAARRRRAASRAALLNAAGSSQDAADAYVQADLFNATSTTDRGWIEVEVTRCAAAGIEAERVVDTTGAGDAYNGAWLYGMATGMDRAATMRLASVVAAAKCVKLGARPGLPTRDEIDPYLLF